MDRWVGARAEKKVGDSPAWLVRGEVLGCLPPILLDFPISSATTPGPALYLVRQLNLQNDPRLQPVIKNLRTNQKKTKGSLSSYHRMGETVQAPTPKPPSLQSLGKRAMTWPSSLSPERAACCAGGAKAQQNTTEPSARVTRVPAPPLGITSLSAQELSPSVITSEMARTLQGCCEEGVNTLCKVLSHTCTDTHEPLWT